MILSFYFAKRFLKSFALTFSLFFVLLSLIDAIEQIGRFSGKGITIFKALLLAVTNTPMALVELLPVIISLAMIAMTLSMARSSELTVMRALGRSGLRGMVGPFCVVVVLSLVTMLILNPLASEAQKVFTRLSDDFKDSASGPKDSPISNNSIWLRDGINIIHAARVDIAQKQLLDVTFFIFDADEKLLKRITAAVAQNTPEGWYLQKGREWQTPEADAGGADAAEANAGGAVFLPTGKILPENLFLSSTLQWEGIVDGVKKPSSVALWNLPSYIVQLENAGLSSRAHKMWLQATLAQPFLLMAIALISAALTMRSVRGKNRGFMALIAALVGFSIFFVRNLTTVFGQNGQIPIGAAAWVVPLATFLIGISLILHLEDG